MKFGKNLNVVIAVAAGIGLLGAGFAAWRSGAGDGVSQISGRLRVLPTVIPACCFLAAGALAWLGWRCRRLTRTIAGIAARLEDSPSFEQVATEGKQTAEALGEAVVKSFDAYGAKVTELQTQLDDLHIRVQLSQQREKNAEAIIYSIRDAVIVTDESHRLLMANEAAGRLFKFDFRNCDRKPIGELICGEHADDGRAEFAEVLKRSGHGKGRATRKDLEFSCDGKSRSFDCIISRVHDRTDRVCGVVAVLHDVTREKEISQMKNDFVSHVSHELKTPLASITAYSEMLCDGEADDEQTRKEFYSVIQSQAKRLNRLIEDILNTSRIESGLVKVSKEPVSLTILLEEQLQMIRSYAEEKSIQVTGQKPIIFDRVYVDRDMISQVIVNLLSNAVKYTPAEGSVRIETDVDETLGIVRLKVSDTGVGIPEAEIEHVFDKFYRVGANKKQAKGTGLGLNLVKQIVEKVHDGRVFVTSEVGVGSTFGFELPLAAGQTVGAT